MLYREIALGIAKLINAGKVDQKLPTEKELMAQFDASRNTIRTALQVLMDAGILISRPGKGYFVNHWDLQDIPTLNFNYRNSFTRNFYKDVKEHANQVLEFKEVACPAKIAQIMHIAPDEQMYLVKRHRDAGELNENYEYSLYRQKLIPYLNAEIASGHIFEFIQKYYHLTDEHSDYYIRQSTQENPFKEYLPEPKLYVTAVHSNNQENFCYSEVYYLDEKTAFYIRS